MAADLPTSVLVLAPMTSELKPIVKGLSLSIDRSRSAATGQKVYEGRVGKIRVHAATVGVGPDEARRSTKHLIDQVGGDHVVVSGIAGGVSRSVNIGDLVFPEILIDHATGTEYRPTGWPGAKLAGTILTTAELITGPAEVEALRSQGVVAVEMEGAAVGEICESVGRPWTVVRSISDRADEGIVDTSVLSLLNPDGSTNVGAAISLIVRRPGRLPKLMRLAQDSQKAATAAAGAVYGLLAGS
jgi:adenosylhomocysteine nucleosidase